MIHVGIFCSASPAVPQKYLDTAHAIGLELGRRGMVLVYGGTTQGMMREVARGVHEGGGKTLGIVPELFEKNGKMAPDLDACLRCETLADRKPLMVSASHVIVALPGGIGTLDEAFSTMASFTLGYHDKRVIFYNLDGFWSPLAAFLEKIRAEGFVKDAAAASWTIVDTPQDLIREITAFPQPPEGERS